MAGNIADVVANDPHIAKIISSEYSSVPEVDESLFSKDMGWHLSEFKRFLCLPYIIDDFADHEHERKPWIQELLALHGRKFWDYAVLGNALKQGNFVHLNGGFTPIIDMVVDAYCGPDKEALELLAEGFKQEHMAPAEYAYLPNSIKAMHVKKLKAYAHAILKFCEKQPVLQNVA
ncbi:hypothetical protein KY338_04880 [Candidatus Woesearchaeota archaeon]|nr:hypothetical protein [Candidatus Woesearchaeota archaeon]MBW3006239.1 hypothetical protein [Candidatus Woesearchaeota archaeon]